MVSRQPWRDWESPLGQGDAQAGKLYDTATRATVAPAALLRRARDVDFVLLGEKHDNPDHHRLQAWLLSTLVREGRHRAVVFEMLTEAQETALAAPGTALQLIVRGKALPATVAPMPFVPHRYFKN